MDKSLIGRGVHGAARLCALAGGIALVLIAALTVLSIVGRMLIPIGLGPIPGDYELVEAGVLFAVFTFLPWCHLTRGNAVVAVVTDNWPPRANAVIETLADLLMLAAALFIGWRHLEGMLDKLAFQETTFILRLPLWWSYAPGLLGASIFVVVAFYCLVRNCSRMISPRPAMPVTGMTE